MSTRKLFPSTGPVLNDIRQGRVGDCYYVATLGAIAYANSDRIKESIVDMGDHTFAARFYNSDGNPIYVRVDDDIPLNASGGAIYAKSGTEGCIWQVRLSPFSSALGRRTWTTASAIWLTSQAFSSRSIRPASSFEKSRISSSI